MGILIDELENTHKTLAVSDNNIVGLWIEANGSELELSCGSIALLSLES